MNNNLISFLLSEADEEDTTDPVSNDKEKDKEDDSKDVNADTKDSGTAEETAPEEVPAEEPAAPEGDEPPPEEGSSDPEPPKAQSIKTKFDTEKDSEGVRNYFIEAFEKHRNTYQSILGLLKTIGRKYEGVPGASEVLSELTTNAKSYLNMVDKARNDYSILTMDLDQIYKIHKMHISNISNLNTVLRSVCKRSEDYALKK